MERKSRKGQVSLVTGALLVVAALLLIVANFGQDVPVDVSDLTVESDGEAAPPEAGENEPNTPPTVPEWLEDLEAAVAEEQPSDSSSTVLDEDLFDAVVRPGDSIREVVDSLPEGSSILLKAGTHLGQQVKPKSGMTFVGEKGAVMDGEGTTPYAFIAWEDDEIDNVTIRGLEIRNYAPIPAMAAITTHRPGWVIEDCHVHHTIVGSGIRTHDNGVIRNCVAHDNDRLGLKTGGENILVEGNEVYANNVRGLSDPTFEAGGIKGGGDGLVFRDNHVHDNNGHGIWMDEGAIHVLYEDNLIEDNTYSGINHEISYDGVIRNNTIRNNGHGDPRGGPRGAGVFLQGPNVTVYGNTVEDNRRGIILLENDRGEGEFGLYDLKNILVYDNLIIDSGENGAVRFDGSSEVFATSQFDRNEYRYSEIGDEWWLWEDSNLDWEGWLAEGNDVNGSLEQVQR